MTAGLGEQGCILNGLRVEPVHPAPPLEAGSEPQFLLRTALLPSGCVAQTQHILQICLRLRSLPADKTARSRDESGFQNDFNSPRLSYRPK